MTDGLHQFIHVSLSKAKSKVTIANYLQARWFRLSAIALNSEGPAFFFKCPHNLSPFEYILRYQYLLRTLTGWLLNFQTMQRYWLFVLQQPTQPKKKKKKESQIQGQFCKIITSSQNNEKGICLWTVQLKHQHVIHTEVCYRG